MGGVCILLALTWFGWCPAIAVITPGLNSGFSLIWFIVVYLIGRYIRLFTIPNWINNNALIIYILFSLLTTILVFATLSYLPFKTEAVVTRLYAYNSPLVIISSVSFFIYFKNVQIEESRCINHLSQSVLSVLLLHTCLELKTIQKEYYASLLANYSGILLVILWTLSVLSMFIGCVIIDQLRIFSYNPIKKYIDLKLNRNGL